MTQRIKLPEPLVNVGRGFLMGGADIVPGVSGGTVALILGIYERWIGAFSRFDLTFLRHVRQGEIAAAARHVDLGFLGTIFLGVGIGIVGLGGLMHYLLEHQTQHTFGAFFGLILASSWHVARMIDGWSWRSAAMLALGAAAAYVLVGLPLLESPPQALWYLFFCGCIAVCAMILPGISGAFILLILGTYGPITEALRNLVAGERVLDSLAVLGVAGTGAVVGLLSFSKFLHWLLAHYEKSTLALLCGFMLGSLRKIWPFKFDETPQQPLFKLKVVRNEWPDFQETGVWLTVGLAVVAFGLVLLLERLSGIEGAHSAPSEE